MSARRKLRPPVPGRSSNHIDSDGSRDGAMSWGAYNIRARKISRQTTQAISTDTDTLSDTDSLYTPENDGQKSKPYTLHQSLPSSSSSSSQLLKDDAQNITSVMEPVPTISKRNTRKKWTSEMNEFILRTYLYLTMMETDTKGYLQPLHMKFIERFPDMQDLVYCAEWTSAKLNGAKIEIPVHLDNPLGKGKQKKYNKPKWEQRLEYKVSELRAKIARLTQYINGNRGNE
ncbi:unnamed protein product [Parnassius mnemosyne]|uniref:Uncharacterized protein n=1 Tax=Parnassius mnemosyne TaxID=213953 RepID=A0AAV1L6C9_9NEOP